MYWAVVVAEDNVAAEYNRLGDGKVMPESSSIFTSLPEGGDLGMYHVAFPSPRLAQSCSGMKKSKILPCLCEGLVVTDLPFLTLSKDESAYSEGMVSNRWAINSSPGWDTEDFSVFLQYLPAQQLS